MEQQHSHCFDRQPEGTWAASVVRGMMTALDNRPYPSAFHVEAVAVRIAAFEIPCFHAHARLQGREVRGTGEQCGTPQRRRLSDAGHWVFLAGSLGQREICIARCCHILRRNGVVYYRCCL